MTPQDIRDFFALQREAKQQPDWEPIERMTSDESKHARSDNNASPTKGAKTNDGRRNPQAR